MRADAVTAMDVCVVAGQLGRRPRPMSAVAAHCPHGFPAAVEMLPVDDHGRPFPTLYYLTCPTAVTAIGALENAGGVDRLQRATDADERLRASLAAAVRETRARREELAAAAGFADAALPVALTAGALDATLATGVGGVADPSRLKCLHAHAAHALARPGYLLGDDIIAAAGGLWCDDRRCAAYAEDAGAAGEEAP